MKNLAQVTDNVSHLIEKGFETMPSIAAHNTTVMSIAVEYLFKATSDNEMHRQAVIEGAHTVLSWVDEKNSHRYKHIIETILYNDRTSNVLAVIMNEAEDVFKKFARTHSSGNLTTLADTMISLAGNDQKLIQKIVRAGQAAIKEDICAHGEKHSARELFETIYSAGKNDPALLPGLIRTAWESILPDYSGGPRSSLIDSIITISRGNPEVREAHIEGARGSRVMIANKDRWKVGAPLKVLRDALDLKGERNILSDFFAKMAIGSGKNEREIWFLPKEGKVLIAEGSFVGGIDELEQDRFKGVGKILGVGRIADAVFNQTITLDEGRREIRKATGLRFETLR